MLFLIVQRALMCRDEDPILLDLVKGPNCLFQVRYSTHIVRLIIHPCTTRL